METKQIIINIILGIALSASCGFRVFIPILVANVAHHLGVYELSGSFAWLGSWTATVFLSVATILEILAYYIPWVDNLLDTIATPLAMTAGALLMTSSLTGMEDGTKWILGIITGATSAGVIQAGTSMVRLASSTTTGGAGNHIVSTGENGAAVGFSIFAFIIPIVIGGILLLFIMVISYFLFRKLFRKKSS